MKTLLLFTSVLFICFSSFAQKRVTITKWEANTKSGGYFIGIAQSRMNALKDIERLTMQTEGTEKEIIDFDVRLSSVSTEETSINIFEQFASTNKEGELYTYLSLNDMTSLKIAAERGISSGQHFYQKVNSIKNEKKSNTKFNTEVYAFQKYLFIKERNITDDYLTYMDN